MLAWQTGQNQIAIDLIRQAISINPKYAVAYNNLGVALKEEGQLEEAESAYRQALSLNPDDAKAHYNLGNVLWAQGQLEEAESAYGQALSLNPDDAKAHNNLGAVLQEEGQLEEAVNAYRQALSLNPDYVDAYNNLGVALKEGGQLEEAISAYGQALSLNPDYAEGYNNLGVALKEDGKLEEAISAYGQALSLNPDYVDAYNNLGNALKEGGQLEEAISAYGQALSLNPDYAEGYNNLGVALKEEGKLEEAISTCRQALSLNPDYVEAHNNLGNALKGQGQLEEAVNAYRQALSLNPDYAEAHFSLAIILLLQGKLTAGWKEYEWRWDLIQKFQKRDFKQSLWDGTSLKGKSILVHTEQGFGDAIQFIRYVDLLCDPTTMIVECHAALKPLFASIDCIDKLVTKGEEIPGFDVHAPLLSLPNILGTTLETIPARIPYLYPDPKADSTFLLDVNHKFKVGIAWAGNPEHVNDHNRSIDLKQFECLLDIGKCEFFSLQVGERREDIEKYEYHHVIKDLGEQFTNFHHTASAILQLDLVISVDTVVAHLAGALGKEVWTLLPFVPDWRWMLNRSDSPWYPSMTLFRQEEIGDWNGVFQQIKLELMQYTRCLV